MSDSSFHLHVAATFTAEPLAEYLSFWARSEGWPWSFGFAGHDRLFQELLDPASELSTNRRGANLLLVRPADFETPEATAAELADALRSRSDRWLVPMILCLCPARSAAPEEAAAMQLLSAAVDTLPAVHPMAFENAVSGYRVRRVFDAVTEAVGAVPYTTELYAALATLAVRTTSRLQRRPAKAIALDCDDTLWDGVVGEIGPSGVAVDGIRAHLQAFMLARRQEGFLLCLCSKNNADEVEAVFASRADMPLQRHHVTSSHIGWGPKSAGIAKLAFELGIHPDSVILVDDSPIECAEVSEALPGTLTIRLPEEKGAIPDFLDHVWAFDRGELTAVDARRADMYEESMHRERSRVKARTLAEFIASLELKIDIRPLRASELERASQLTHRTNQFNFGAVRRSSAEIERFLAEVDGRGFAVNVADRFGDYGFVGLCLCNVVDGLFDVDTFLLSCRALSRGVEHRMLARLAEVGLEEGCTRLRLTLRRTSRNAPARAFYASVTGVGDQSATERDAERTSALLRCDSLTTLRYDPEESERECRTPATALPAPPARGTEWLDDNRIATLFRDADSIIDAVREQRRGEVAAGTGRHLLAPPRGEREQAIARIWSDVLHRDDIGRDENFFDIGGTSLRAVQVVARLRRGFRVDLPLEVLFSARTIGELDVALGETLSMTTSGEI